MELKHKNVSVAGVKVVDEDAGIVEAFVAGIGNKDSQKDIIQPGAFDASLAARNPKCVWSHDWDTPVGKCLEAYEVSAGSDELPTKMKDAGCGGLFTRTQFNLKTQRGQDAYHDVVFFGDEQEWSIGYREEKAHWDKDADANIVEKVGLYEYSPVLFGANSATATVSAKAAEVVERAIDAARTENLEALEALKDELDGGERGETNPEARAEAGDPADTPSGEEVDAPVNQPEGEDVAPTVTATGGEPEDPGAGVDETAEAASTPPSGDDPSTPKDALEGRVVDGDQFAAWRQRAHAKAVEEAAGADDRVKAYGVPGSLERFMSEIGDALGDTGLFPEGTYAWPVATFNDRVVVGWDRAVTETVDVGDGLFYSEVVGWEMGYVQFDVTVEGDGEVELSNPVPVDIVQQIVPVDDDRLVNAGAQVMGRIVVEVGDEAKALIESLGVSAEKVGRVLSQSNYEKVVAARDSLDAVIEAATPAEVDDKAKADDESGEVEPHAFVGEGDECEECGEGPDAKVHATADGDDGEKVTLTFEELTADLNL